MIRPTSLILMVLAATAGGALFQVAFEVSELDDELALLNRDIRTDRDAIHVLRAEWSFLNQPERLEELTRRRFIEGLISARCNLGAVERLKRFSPPWLQHRLAQLLPRFSEVS